MDEAQFTAAAERTLAQLEAAIEGLDESIDLELKPGGILELEFDDGAKIIINRHAAAREIWVAAKSGGFHFRFDQGRWVDTRSGEELFAALSALISTHTAAPVRLSS